MSDAADEIMAHIEIPKGSRNKYEYDEEAGGIIFDRYVSSSTVYPTDYGFLPGYRGEDEDPLDCLVCVSEPTFPGCLVPSRAIAVFRMADEKGQDDKIVCVPTHDPHWNEMEDLDDIPTQLQQEIEHFFKVYKDLEPGKSVEVQGYEPKETALKILSEARDRYKEYHGTEGA
ncbi:MAG: inorganic diphosphatase [Solirubrobacterales bacterium]